MPVYTIDIENIKALELAIDAAVASAKRAINTSKRPEFTPVYEKEILVLTNAKASIKPAEHKAK